MKTQKYFKHPTRSFVKNLTDSAIELAVRPWQKAKTMVPFLLKH
jgi:hypothetical protein